MDKSNETVPYTLMDGEPLMTSDINQISKSEVRFTTAPPLDIPDDVTEVIIQKQENNEKTIDTLIELAQLRTEKHDNLPPIHFRASSTQNLLKKYVPLLDEEQNLIVPYKRIVENTKMVQEGLYSQVAEQDHRLIHESFGTEKDKEKITIPMVRRIPPAVEIAKQAERELMLVATLLDKTPEGYISFNSPDVEE